MDSSQTRKNNTVSLDLKSLSGPRKLVVVALIVHFFSLFLMYQDEDQTAGTPIMWNTGAIVNVGNRIPEQTGFQLKPFAPFVIGALLLVFLTSIYQHPFWKKYGYWVTVVAIFFFAMGGAVVRTTGGNLSLLTWGLMIIAALLNSLSKKDATKKEA